MLDYLPDFEKVSERYEAWWQGAIVDRAPVSITLLKPEDERVPVPASHHETHQERWLDTDYVVEASMAGVSNRIYAGDSLPVVWPNLGPEVFSALYGCPLIYGERTTWSEPILADWSRESLKGLKLNWEHPLLHKLDELTEGLLEAARGRCLVGYTDLHGGGDAIAAFRDPEALLIDTLEYPEAIRELTTRITGDFLQLYDRFHDRLSRAGMPSTTWTPVTGKGKVHIPSNDFSCMISERAFAELFLPGIMRECRHMDRCLYHLDGPQALRHLDLLLEIPEIDAIQWVPGVGRDYWADWIHVYRKIQEAGKSLQLLNVPVTDLHLLFESLRPEGVWLSNLSGIQTRAEAAAALKAISRWTG